MAVSPTNKPRPEIIPESWGVDAEGTPTCQTRIVGGRGAPEVVRARLDAQLTSKQMSSSKRQAEVS